MESAAHQHDNHTKSLRHCWHHCKEMFLASTPSEAWQSFKQAIDALPIWALVLLPFLATVLAIESSLLLIPLAMGGFLWLVYETVKRAVKDAYKESDHC